MSINSICCDSKCKHSIKIIKGVIDEMDHERHNVVHFNFLKNELNKSTHPIKKLLQSFEYDNVLQLIDKRVQQIKNIFNEYLIFLSEQLKNNVIKIYQEADLIKSIYKVLQTFDLSEIQYRQEELSRQIPRLLDQNNLLTLSHQVMRSQIDPLRTLEEFQNRLKAICEKPGLIQIIDVDESNDLLQKNMTSQTNKYKSQGRNEPDIIKQLQLKSKYKEIEVDLNGQMINRSELKMPNQLFLALRTHSKTISDLKLRMSSTNLCDNNLSELSNTLMYMQLKSLVLHFGNTKLVRIHDLGKGISHLKHCEKLEISLWNTNVSDVSEIGKGIGQIKTLEELELQLGNTFVENVSELGKGIGENTKIRNLSLNLEFTKVYEVDHLGIGLAKLKLMKDFQLNLQDSLVPQRLKKNFTLVNHFINDLKNSNKEK